jgi:hypothetical protein
VKDDHPIPLERGTYGSIYPAGSQVFIKKGWDGSRGRKKQTTDESRVLKIQRMKN